MGSEVSIRVYVRKPKAQCSVPGCPELTWCKGLCRFHDQRKRKGTPLTAPYMPRTINRQGWISHGYLWIMVDGKEVMYHRWLMGVLEGRELGYDEVVHHKDGDKTNNSPDNLEILGRAEHTSHHRPHGSFPCRICGRVEPPYSIKKGGKGLCYKHLLAVNRLLYRLCKSVWRDARILESQV